MNLTRHLYERQVFDMSNSYTHLTLQDRIIIAAGISNGSSKTAIADTIGKDKSTVGKEIRLHRFLKYKCRLPRECAAYKKCPSDRNCTPDCPDFVPFRCRSSDFRRVQRSFQLTHHFDLLSLLYAQRQLVAAHADLDGIAHRRDLL